jgi:DNA polymerase
VRVVHLASATDLAGWRRAARALRNAAVAPGEIAWRVDSPDDGDPAGRAARLTPPLPPRRPADDGEAFTVPPRFLQLAGELVDHRSPARFDLLYRLLWRLRDEPALMALVTDPEVAQALAMAKAVSRAAHKMKAFVRFRLVPGQAQETYVAWFEPPHRVVERTAPFFRDRFSNQRFSILTPDLCCHWDLERLRFTPGRSRPPQAQDELEAIWLTYYASIFNPARLKTAAMQAEMPKRYWRNLPEAALIPGLVREAQARTRTMIQADPTSPARRVPARAGAGSDARLAGETPMDLGQTREAVQACRRCALWKDATQAVTGEGPADAPLMLVGEQPGDLEDLEGRPFVGPAGQLLSRALAAAGIAREATFVTNAVKHFKHEARGRRRLHKTPDAAEVQACRWWLDQERALLRPRVVVALGATAALAVFGRPMAIMKSRGRPLDLETGGQGLVTLHPAYLLRLPDEAAKAAAWRAFVNDLITARDATRELATGAAGRAHAGDGPGTMVSEQWRAARIKPAPSAF